MKKAIIFWIGIFTFLMVGFVYGDCTSLNNATAYYSFDQDCETDISGNNYTGTNNGSVNTGTGIKGNGCHFEEDDGDNGDYVNVDVITSGSFDFGQAHTYCGWMKMETTDSDMYMWSAKVPGTSTYTDSGFSNSLGDYMRTVMDPASGLASKSSTPDEFEGNTSWHFICSAIASNGYIDMLYVDGTDYGVNVDANDNPNDLAGATNVRISGIYWATNEIGPVDGDLDEMSLYNFSMEKEQADLLYNSGEGCNPYADYISTPYIYDINCTSSYPEYNGSQSPYTTFDTTPTFTLTTSTTANCRISDNGIVYSSMTQNCTGFGTTSHICSLQVEDELSDPNDWVYIHCVNSANLSLETNVSLQMSISLLEVNATLAIQRGIENSVIYPGASVFTDQQIYLRGLGKSALLETVDKVAVFGNQRWLLNYNDNNVTLGLYNISPVVYVLDLVNYPLLQIDEFVQQYIDSTKN